MVSVATPADRVPVPITVVPSRKVTVPVGVPAVEVTFAVSVIAFCSRTGLALLVTLAAEAVLPITSVPDAVPA